MTKSFKSIRRSLRFFYIRNFVRGGYNLNSIFTRNVTRISDIENSISFDFIIHLVVAIVPAKECNPIAPMVSKLKNLKQHL